MVKLLNRSEEPALSEVERDLSLQRTQSPFEHTGQGAVVELPKETVDVVHGGRALC